MGSNCCYLRGATVGPVEQALEEWFLELACDNQMTEKLLIIGNMLPDIKTLPDDDQRIIGGLIFLAGWQPRIQGGFISFCTKPNGWKGKQFNQDNQNVFLKAFEIRISVEDVFRSLNKSKGADSRWFDFLSKQRLVELESALNTDSTPEITQRTDNTDGQNQLSMAPIAASSEALHPIQNRYAPVSYPDEITDQEYAEGAVKTITVNAYERDLKAREACIRHYGCVCYVCGFDFSKIYGERGEGFIHVHHIRELSTIRERYIPNPIVDLRPLCPNCHAMVHREKPAMDPDKLKTELSAWRAYNSEFNKSS